MKMNGKRPLWSFAQAFVRYFLMIPPISLLSGCFLTYTIQTHFIQIHRRENFSSLLYGCALWFLGSDVVQMFHLSPHPAHFFPYTQHSVAAAAAVLCAVSMKFLHSDTHSALSKIYCIYTSEREEKTFFSSFLFFFWSPPINVCGDIAWHENASLDSRSTSSPLTTSPASVSCMLFSACAINTFIHRQNILSSCYNKWHFLESWKRDGWWYQHYLPPRVVVCCHVWVAVAAAASVR